MFEVYRFSEREIILFALMLVRISSCLVILPIFGNRNVPNQIKVLLSLAVTFILFPIMQRNFSLPLKWQDDIILFVGREAICGLFMGFLARLIFIGVEAAGQILS